MGSNAVEFDGVSRTFGADTAAVRALDIIDLDIAPGEFVALVGPSGCGKSTLLRMVAALDHPDHGAVTVAGREAGAKAASIGLAFQNPTMLPWLTVEANVMLPLKIVPPYRQHFRQEKRQAFRDRVHALLERVGLKDFALKYPWQLSGGMLQRASLCRALIHDPQILLLDEPFGALDQFTREGLWRSLQDIWIERRPTVLLVTHDLREAAFLSSRIIVMSPRPGRIVDDIVVPLVRPRTIAGTYEPEAVALCQRMRMLIDVTEAGTS
ncbi:ABC transporter ATP-binding protein [Devosia sp. 919]|uniref:ABC transporter ATP-binding protein n=1 Tax=Devosia sp. 919 TaxID=2726065 RepID=UPI0020C042A4|nr:ABC transporter ATP-binding protein [Devosia sp. 919]